MQLKSATWASHPNTKDYQGSWESLALRSLNGESDDVKIHSDDPDAYRDTPLLASCPAIQRLLDDLPWRTTSIRLLSLKAGSQILPHQDPGCGLWDGIARLHFPIETNEEVEFLSDGERLQLAAGECWYLNATFEHAVNNHSTQDRVHLVIDCVADDELSKAFLYFGHPPRPARFDDPSVNCSNALAVANALRTLSHPGSEQLANRILEQARELCPELPLTA